MTTPTLLCGTLLTLLPLLAGQAPAPQPDATQTLARTPVQLPWPTDRVLTDTTADGTLWAATAGWKAGFEVRGATFHPFLGGDAPATAATFTLRSAHCGATTLAVGSSRPQLHGQCVVAERGDVREQYVLRQDGVEQQFVLSSLPNRETLQLEVAVTTALAHQSNDAGHAFVGELGGVQYGHALAIDAAGRRLPLHTTWHDGALQITVPAAFLADVQLPLLVDPLIGAITNLTTTNTVALSAVDLAFDQSLAMYFAVYERAFNAVDHDVFVVQLDLAMQPLSLVTIDYSSAYWSRPRIAALEAHDKVGVVAQVSVANAPPFQVNLRTFLGGASPVVDPVTIVSAHAQYSRKDPDIGGDANPVGPTNFLVAFESFHSAVNVSDLLAQLIDANGNVTMATNLNNGISFARRPAISKTCGLAGGTTEGWAIVLRAEFYQTTLGELRAWQVTPGGSVRNATGIYMFAPLGGTTQNNGSEWDVSSPTDHADGRRFLCVERRLDTQNGRGAVIAHAFDWDGAITATNVTVLPSTQDRLSPVVDSDGCRFAIASATRFSATDSDVRCDTVALLGSQPTIQDTDVVSYSSARDDQPAICARHGSHNTYGVAWVHEAGNWSLQGQVYRGTAATGVVTRATGCGGITLGWTGELALGETFTVSVSHATGIAGFLVGAPVSVPIGPCPGCTQGANGIALVGSLLNVAVPANTALVGSVFAFQGVRYDPALGPCLGALAFSDTLDVAVR